MALAAPVVLILGHSFVKRICHDLDINAIPGAYANFDLHGTASVRLHGIGGRTVAKLRKYDLHVVRSLSPDIVILEIGTNDLSVHGPEVVGSAIDELVELLRVNFSVRVVVVCEIISRGSSNTRAENFNASAKVLNRYVRAVLEHQTNVFTWQHRGFINPYRNLLLPDGVHVNPAGQYCLYRSYRGAIKKALNML